MLKKLLTVGLALTMMFAVTACSSKDSDSDKPNDNNTSDNTKQERPFTESNGLMMKRYVCLKQLASMLNI